jgi:hypothetical protein
MEVKIDENKAEITAFTIRLAANDYSQMTAKQTRAVDEER